MHFLNYVNCKQGTNSSKRFSQGNTLPLTQMPHDMVSFTLQTNSERGNWFYHPSDRSLEGIRLTHQPSPWMGDYGQILFTPQRGICTACPEASWSGYSPDQTRLTPAEIQVKFLRARTTFSLTPSDRCAIMKLQAETSNTYLTVRLPGRQGGLYASSDGTTVHGFTEEVHGGAPEGFREYFVLKFEPPLPVNQILDDTSSSQLTAEGPNCALHLPLPIDSCQQVRLGTSFISWEQAETNLTREIGSDSYTTVLIRCQNTWENLLGRIVLDAPLNQLQTFYSCLYRVFLFPRMLYEESSAGKIIHISMKDNSVVPGIQYTDSGYWDTYRSQYPLLCLLEPSRYHHIVQGCLQFYKDTGWLPRWLSPGERGTMPGTLIDGVLADAAAKDVLTVDEMQTALRGMLHHADSGDGNQGRIGGKDYAQFGYLSADRWPESVSVTLDYAYGDFCIAVVAGKLGYSEIQEKFTRRSQGYRSLFDPETGLLRPKTADGCSLVDWNPLTWGNGYCEGSAWQSSFQIAFDLDGWIKLQGSRDACIHLLDQLFSTPPLYNVGSYQAEIHEMTEMALAPFGQCAINNQPSFLTPYLYALLGKRKKSAHVIRQILRQSFSADMYPGDEDNGSMAAWYIFSTLGFYPYCPGKPEYLAVQAQARKAVISLDNGKILTIVSSDDSTLPDDLRILSHDALMQGGCLTL